MWKINQEQAFYTALYWMNALPKGADFNDFILAKYNMPAINVESPLRDIEQIKEPYFYRDEIARYNAIAQKLLDGVTQEEAELFFESLYGSLVKNEVELQYNATGRHKYLGLMQSIVTRAHFFDFSSVIEVASAMAGIDAQILGVGMTYLHEKGQLFVRDRNANQIVLVAHIGDFAGDKNRITRLEARDMTHCPTMQIETRFRVMPLVEGQAYHHGYKAVNGKMVDYEDTAYAGQFMYVSQDSFDDPALFDTLSDNEIINMPAVGMADDIKSSWLKAHAPDLFAQNRLNDIPAPRIISVLSPPHYVMNVSKDTQIGYGGHFEIAQAGDFIVAQVGTNMPSRLIKAAKYEKKVIRFHEIAPAPSRLEKPKGFRP